MSLMLCQSCKTPLKLDSSLEDLSSTALRQLIISSSHLPEQDGKPPVSRDLFPQNRKDTFDRALGDAKQPILSQTNIPSHSSSAKYKCLPQSAAMDHPDMSFVILTNSQVIKSPGQCSSEPSNVTTNPQLQTSRRHLINCEDNVVSQKMETSSQLFEILNSHSDIDYPVCAECTAILLEKLEKKLANVIREKDAFLEYIKNANADVPTDEEINRMKNDLRQIKLQEKSARDDLKALEAEKDSLQLEMTRLEEEAKQLDEDEKLLWKEKNAMMQSISTLQDEEESVKIRYRQDSRQLERLQRTNVYNDTFSISHDGAFATINGLRLGRTNPPTVDWPEINAAWGYTCLLLATVAEKLTYSFKDYRLVPMGSTSFLEKLNSARKLSNYESVGGDRNPSLPLYHSGDLPLNLGFLTRNFNNGMVAFLQCLSELGQYVEKTTKEDLAFGRGVGLKLPYEIEKDRIHDCSIRIANFSGGEESWTKACKYTLTCCKFLLAHVSSAQTFGVKST